MGIGFILFLVIGIATGAWLEAAIAGAIIGIVLFMFQEDAKDARAYYNFRDYWADRDRRR